MSRPLLITDCDEVLLHMVRHFGAWLDEAHDIVFRPEGGAFETALTQRASGAQVPAERVWPLLEGFFRTEMDRQTLVPGAGAALERISAVADIVILTNLQDWCHAGRVAQLDALGIRHRVVCNQGGKGRPVARLAAEHSSSVTAFVDDLEGHHKSVADHAPEVFRLHMIAEPAIAPTIPPAPHAHARIDQWDEAAEWVLARFRGESLLDGGAARAEGAAMSIDDRLAELGIALPEPAAPVAAYVPAVEANGLLHISGQLPFRDGELMTGRCGEDRDEDFARQAAERCGVMLLAQMKAALGSLDRVARIVKLGVFVSSAAGFTAQPKVANGASELMQNVFGEAGRHARSAVGVPVLPLNAVVEIDAVVAVRS